MRYALTTEQDAIVAFKTNNLPRAFELSKKCIEKGVKSENVWVILSEAEFMLGDPNYAFSICLKLARQKPSIQHTLRLTKWFLKTFDGFDQSNGKFIKNQYNHKECKIILDTIATGMEFSSKSASEGCIAESIINAGSIGYLIDQTPYQHYPSFAKRIIKAIPFSRSDIPSICLKYFTQREVRMVSYFLAAAGYYSNAKALIEKVSAPFKLKPISGLNRERTIPQNMTLASHYDSPQIRRTSLRLSQLIHKKSNLGKVLDIGCGTGLTSCLIKDRASYLHGVDLNADYLKVAFEKNIFDKLDQSDFLKWSQANKKFNTIVSCMVTYLVPDFKQFIAKVSSLLHVNGTAYIDIPTCSGSADQRRLDESFYRTKNFLMKVINQHNFVIKQEKIGPWASSVAYYLELEKQI